MWIKRDFLINFKSNTSLESILLKGPRQIGKTSMLIKLEPTPQSTLFLDDPNEQDRAINDPEFVISQLKLPTVIDEIQRAPDLTFSIKKKIDSDRRDRISSNKPVIPASFRLTGSNQTEIDNVMKESLAGRVSIFYVHGLSINEIWNFAPETELNQILFKGGFPELWVRSELDTIQFLNNYISTFIEKDIARTAGIEKLSEFIRTLKLLAARTGELLNYESIGNDANVTGKSVKDWISILEQNGILLVLKPFHSNLNKRLIKMPKIYFLDTGLCVRLQGHQSKEAILSTPHAGHLFENLVVSEVIKTRDHFLKNWNLYFWRNKEKEEIDLIIESEKYITLLQIKLGSSRGAEFQIPKEIKDLKKKTRQAIIVVTGERARINENIEIVPLKDFCKFLLENEF